MTWGTRLAHSPNAASANASHSDLDTEYQSHEQHVRTTVGWFMAVMRHPVWVREAAASIGTNTVTRVPQSSSDSNVA